jgi:hypothetical protein
MDDSMEGTRTATIAAASENPAEMICVYVFFTMICVRSTALPGDSPLLTNAAANFDTSVATEADAALTVSS